MKFGPSAWKTSEEAMQREWLLTNGIGGYASTSITGANNSRYHGLLIASLGADKERHMILSQMSEAVVSDNSYHTLLSFHTKDQFNRGEENLLQFEWNGMPIWRYQIQTVSIDKQVVLVNKKNITAIRYIFKNGNIPVSVHLTPLLNYRNHHFLSYNQYTQFKLDFDGRHVMAIPFGSQDVIHIDCSEGAIIKRDRMWFYNMDYPLDRSRGLPSTEDHYIPGYYDIPLLPYEEKTVTVVVSMGEIAPHLNGSVYIDEEMERINRLPFMNDHVDHFVKSLALAADHHIVSNPVTHKACIVAGYPWIGSWGRDSLISLPGLLLKTKRYDDAADVLRFVSKKIENGLLENQIFPEQIGEKSAGADGALWFFEVLYLYYHETNSIELVHELYPILLSIYQSYKLHNVPGMDMSENGFLTCVQSNKALSWMNASVGNWIVTPRIGKVVEMNALWYNALRILCFFMSLIEHQDREFIQTDSLYREEVLQTDSLHQEEVPFDKALKEEIANIADSMKLEFLQIFWNEQNQCLYDVADTPNPDHRIRPNQIWAMSLSYPILEGEYAKKAIQTVYRSLYANIGFRSLNADHDQYRGRYTGDQYAREGALHQGSVWPSFIGPFIIAWSRIYFGEPGLKKFIKQLFIPIEDHLLDGCLGSISEIADGDYPHELRGCISQAWSIGEILRAYIDHYLHYKEE